MSRFHRYSVNNTMLIYMQKLDATLVAGFNNEHPTDYHRPSLFVSDIVALKQNGVVSCHYVDSFGFQEIPAFLQPGNYLKSAEMPVEDDYDMIDGIIDNGKNTTVAELTQMRGYLGTQETELLALMDFALGKLRNMSNEEYATLDLFPDFGEESRLKE